MNVSCYNPCYSNAVKEFWTLCILSIHWLVGDHVLLRDFGPYTIMFMMYVLL
jgi:hypothetical protein